MRKVPGEKGKSRIKEPASSERVPGEEASLAGLCSPLGSARFPRRDSVPSCSLQASSVAVHIYNPFLVQGIALACIYKAAWGPALNVPVFSIVLPA